MKSPLFYLLLLFICHTVSSQEKDSIFNKTSVDIVLSKIDSIEDVSVSDSARVEAILEKVDMSEEWDTLKFNPYQRQFKKLPFQIAFRDSTYASPVKRKKIVTSHYGWRRGRPHKGIDIDLVTGDSVMSMLDGVVRFAHYSTGHGKTVIVRHFNGLETAYAHLSKYTVKANDTVKKGEVIGVGGTSGNARGSHLHLVVSYKGDYINPDYLFDFGAENKIRKQHLWITNDWITAYNHSSKKQSKLLFYNTYEEALASHKERAKRKIHVIKPGDTLFAISNTYKVPVVKLCKINSITKKSTLKIGKKLMIQ